MFSQSFLVKLGIQAKINKTRGKILKKAIICTAAGLICSALFLSCATTNTSTAKTNQESEELKMDYISKNAISNGYAGDCPVEVQEPRFGISYGNVSHVTYYSNTCKMNRGFNILLPGSYDGEKEYPVIYFQHGIFGDENSIIHDAQNRIRYMTANMAADGNAKEFIMVFGNMYATDDPAMKPAFNNDAVKPYDNFINELINDLMPFVESKYKVLKGRENTAICGFSMGGRETLYIGLQRPDLFGYIGAIAPAPGLVPAKDWAMSHPGMIPEDEAKFKDDAQLPELLMVCCGTNDGTVGQFPKTYHKLFEKNNVDHLWFEVLSADHNAHAIRSGLFQFIQRVFK